MKAERKLTKHLHPLWLYAQSEVFRQDRGRNIRFPCCFKTFQLGHIPHSLPMYSRTRISIKWKAIDIDFQSVLLIDEVFDKYDGLGRIF